MFRLRAPSGLWGHGGSTPARVPGERSHSFDWHVALVQIVPSWLWSSCWSWAGMLSTGQPASPAGLTLPANLTLSLKYKSGLGHYFTLSSNTTKTPKQRQHSSVYCISLWIVWELLLSRMIKNTLERQTDALDHNKHDLSKSALM